MLKLSIIIPVYNTAKYLNQCLDSVLAIPLSDKEIIVVNDGSTDNSPEIIEEYKSNIIIINTLNKGLSAARNHGLKAATGKYVLFLDSDDFLYPLKIIELLDYAERYDTDILLGRFCKCDEEGCLIDWKQESKSLELLTSGDTFYDGKALNDASIIVACLKLCRRDFLLQNSIYFVEGLFHEDVLFSFLCSKYAKKMLKTEIVFYAYRQRNSSIMHTPSIKKQIHKLYIVEYITSHLSENNSEFWSNLAIGIYFDVLRKSQIRNKDVYCKLRKIKKLRLIEYVKLKLIPFLHFRASNINIEI